MAQGARRIGGQDSAHLCTVTDYRPAGRDGSIGQSNFAAPKHQRPFRQLVRDADRADAQRCEIDQTAAADRQRDGIR